MSYVEQHLLPGETVAFRTTLHWKIYVLPAVVGILLLPLLAAALMSPNKLFAAFIAILLVLVIGVPYLRRRFAEFAVTDKRVLVKLGVTHTRSVELLLSKVEGITVNQGLGGKLLGYGEIVITGTGGTPEIFSGIQSPFEFRRAVQMATDARDAH
jgi:uncharacterized membrane protein YdbT with pleckstrin-like domain